MAAASFGHPNSVPSPYSAHLPALCQLCQGNISHRIDTMVVPVLGLVRWISVTILIPHIAAQILQDA